MARVDRPVLCAEPDGQHVRSNGDLGVLSHATMLAAVNLQLLYKAIAPGEPILCWPSLSMHPMQGSQRIVSLRE